MKSAVIVILLLVVLIAGSFLYNPESIPDDQLPPEDQTEYVGEQTTIMHKDFKTIIKDDWKEYEVMPEYFVYLPPEADINDTSSEYISIVVTPLYGQEISLNQLLETGINNTNQTIPDFELTESIDGGNSYLDGKLIRFTGTQDGVKRNNVQVFGIKYDNIYTITYSCPVDNCNYYPIYNTLIDSFQPVNDQ